MAQYATSLGELEHHALVLARKETVPEGDVRAFAKVNAAATIPEFATEYISASRNATVIHAHSSWAGVLVRSMRRPAGARIVYSPHALAYLAKKWHHPRSWTRAAELALRARADGYGAVSNHEASQLMALGVPHSKIVVVPHSVPTRDLGRPEGLDTIVAVGRICAQKNPPFFAEVAQRMRGARTADGRPFKFVWVGAGDPGLTRVLTDSGVAVTGWIDRESLLGLLAERALMLVHGAHYEGLPIALVEAMSLGIPVVARRIPSLEDLDSALLVNDAQEAARVLESAIQEDYLTSLAKQCIQEVRQKFSPRAQRIALAQLYGLESA